MPFFTLNFYTKVLILATLLAVGVWNQRNPNNQQGQLNNQIANSPLKSTKTTNVLAATLNKF